MGIPNFLSVVIATKNPCWESFHAVLLSIKKQEVRDVELILVDDGSDFSVDINEIKMVLSEIEVIVIRNSKSFGQGYALRQGIQAAKGEIIVRMDDDDWVLPGTFKGYLKCFAKGVDLAVLNVVLTVGKKYLRSKRAKYFCRQAALNDLARLKFPFAHSGMAFRKTAYQEVGGYDVDGVGQDFSLMIRLLNTVESCRVEDGGVMYSLSIQGASQYAAENRRMAYEIGYRALPNQIPLFRWILRSKSLFWFYLSGKYMQRIALMLLIQLVGKRYG